MSMCVPIQAKGELRAARAEIDELKEDKAILSQTLDMKAKEIRMQLLQVHICIFYRRRHDVSPLRQRCTVLWPLYSIHELFVSCSLK